MFSKNQLIAFDAFDSFAEEEKAEEERLSQSALLRYQKRRRKFSEDGKKFPRLRHDTLWILHNCIVHPMLAISPTEKVVDLHQLTSKWLNKMYRVTLSGVMVPKIPNRKAWVKHNLFAHLAIGFVPCEKTFAYHDETAKEMNVPYWV